MKSFSRYVFLISLILITNTGFSQTLKQQALTKINTLNALILQVENEGFDARKEKMTMRTAEIFLDFADWDEANQSENKTYFDLVPIYADSSTQMAAMLPDFERQEVIIMLDEAIAYLHKLRTHQVFRKPIPQIDWSMITHQNNTLTYNNRPVFLEDYTWQPKIPYLSEYHGNLDGFYIRPAHVIDPNGTIKTSVLNELNTKPTGTAGFVFINNNNIPSWTDTQYGSGFQMRGHTYTGFDIDHSGAKQMMGFLLDGTIPQMAGKKYSQLGYMLCNEPHFFTQANVWATDSVSYHTKNKFKTWLAIQHSSITDLNTLWGTNFNSFNDVTITIPIDGNLQGTPIWYDWVLFNMYRVSDWYAFMKGRIQQSDPNAKIHLKIMPHLWSGVTTDHGIDLETLTEMSEIIGNDAGAWNNHMWGATEWWEADYNFAWRDMTMPYDFMKSVSPNKIIMNTEAHYLSKGKSRNLYENPPYTRATYWLAHTFGMNASQTWFWARKADGSIRNNSGNGYAGSNNQQPRIVNELHSTLMDLNTYSEEITAMQQQAKPLRIFYSKTSAINKTHHQDATFELYESLFFEGTPIGFASKNIINNQNNNDWEAILIYDTEFVTQDELNAIQAYLDNGGTIIKDNISLTKNEYGVVHSALNQSNGTIIIKNNVPQIKAQALSILNTKGLMPEVTISETNGGNTKGCHWKCVQLNGENNVVSIVNMGNRNATLNLNLNGANSTYCLDLLKGLPRSSTVTLKPFEMLFMEVSDTFLTNTETKIALDNKIKIYPNPSTGNFTIDFPTIQNKVELRVFDVTGKLVFNKNYNAIQQINENISNQASGNYIIQVIADKDVFSQMFLKK